MPARDVDQLVIDGNVALKAALVDQGFAGWDAINLHAPTLIWSEAASGASQLRWRGEITAEQARAAIGRLLGARIDIVPSRDLLSEALDLSRKLGWAKSYDAEYVALAKRLGIPLMTIDARLAGRVRGEIDLVTPAEVDEALRVDRSDQSDRV